MMNSGNTCKNLKTQNSVPAGRFVFIRRLVYFLTICTVGISACGKDADEQREVTHHEATILPSKISPRNVRIGDLSFLQTYAELRARHPALSCRIDDMGDRICVWKLTNFDRRHGFAEINAITMKFINDRLHEMIIKHAEMFDVEYTAFEEKLNHTFGMPNNESSSDSTRYQWRSDSLIIILFPNHKLHWTKSVYTYTPTITYKERTLRK